MSAGSSTALPDSRVRCGLLAFEIAPIQLLLTSTSTPDLQLLNDGLSGLGFIIQDLGVEIRGFGLRVEGLLVEGA